MRTKKRFHLLMVLACFAVISLGACGVKPSHVEPPEDSQNKNFPRTYPDPSNNL